MPAAVGDASHLLCARKRAAGARPPARERLPGRSVGVSTDTRTPRTDVAPATTEATWLILPVVIRLSQRLSHACLSISESETANGSLYQL